MFDSLYTIYIQDIQVAFSDKCVVYNVNLYQTIHF